MHFIFVAVVATCCVFADAAKWTYTPGPYGPANWKKVNANCGKMAQSPIDIKLDDTKYSESLGAFDFMNYDKVLPNTTFVMKNNGHAVSVFINYPANAGYKVNGSAAGKQEYKPFQFHFHWGATKYNGSEHIIDGKPFPGELHFIQQNIKYGTIQDALKHSDGLMVFGTFLKISKTDNSVFSFLTTYINQIIYSTGNNSVNIPPFELNKLLPKNTKKFFNYKGSLTTPDCQEVVNWVVMNETMEISENQLMKLRSTINGNSTSGFNVVDNFRPVLPLNSRQVYSSFKAAANAVTVSSILILLALFNLLVVLS